MCFRVLWRYSSPKSFHLAAPKRRRSSVQHFRGKSQPAWLLEVGTLTFISDYHYEVVFVTRFQVSCGDSSPSSLHLRLERWCADMMIWTSWENLVEVAVLPLAFDHLVNRRNNEERSIGYKEFQKCSRLTLSFQDLVLSATIIRV